MGRPRLGFSYDAWSSGLHGVLMFFATCFVCRADERSNLLEVLDQLGYTGESLGEKLRSVNPNQFHTLNNAWDAHRVRNEIAHQGSSYQLSEHLAHRTIANYEAVFREHGEI